MIISGILNLLFGAFAPDLARDHLAYAGLDILE
jgi:hypothetical protein